MKGGDYIVNIKVIGANCSNGMKILKNLSKVERELDMEFNIEKIDSTYKKKYNINVIPALMIEDKVVSTGNVLTDIEIKNYIKELA
ncbi:MAG TPA: thioredoxin family protein [Candidatus Onthousia faecipullorum]|uniref:Thioredoxin family protein n=1 Tax=Candidatus Onthousia faecipullorum TaxID=2840887 RepID=A0A9D1GDR4_9FIRM|nr:thioredoxin family protein [Candidatus Onthousia faecipullorum]